MSAFFALVMIGPIAIRALSDCLTAPGAIDTRILPNYELRRSGARAFRLKTFYLFKSHIVET